MNRKRILHKRRPADKKGRTAVRTASTVLQNTVHGTHHGLLNASVSQQTYNSCMWAGILFLRYLKSEYDNKFKFTVFSCCIQEIMACWVFNHTCKGKRSKIEEPNYAVFLKKMGENKAYVCHVFNKSFLYSLLWIYRNYQTKHFT